MKNTDIMSLENECIIVRKRLSALTQEYYAGNADSRAYNEAYRDKIQFLETELDHLNNQLKILKSAVQMPTQAPTQQAIPHIVTRQADPTPQDIASKKMPKTKPVKEPKSYENLLGRNLMGVFASVLVFISLAMFAALVLPNLSDSIKMICMFAFSLLLIAVGGSLHKKNEANNFYIALTACGMGSFYISLLTTYLRFHGLTEVQLYLAILAWAGCIKLMTSIRNTLFQVVGQWGITISTAMGTAMCIESNDPKLFLTLSLFYGVASMVISGMTPAYFQNQSSQRYKDYIPSHIGHTVNMAMLTAGLHLIGENPLQIITAVIIGALFLFELWCSFREEITRGILFNILSCINLLTAIGFLYTLDIVPDKYFGLAIYAIAMLFLIYTQCRKSSVNIVPFVWCTAIAILGVTSCDLAKHSLFGYLLPLPYFIYGAVKEKHRYLIAGTAMFALMLGISPRYTPPNTLEGLTRSAGFLLMVLLVSTAYLMASFKTEHPITNAMGYVIMCVGIAQAVNDTAYTALSGEKSEIVAFIAVSVIHLVLSRFSWLAYDTAMKGPMRAVNAVLMATSCYMLSHHIWHIPIILTAVCLFVVNSRELMEDGPDLLKYYVALKYTVLTIAILNSFNAVNYVISIALLLFAIISIWYGFYSQVKPFRMYGLVLSMISVAKLIMIDAHSESTARNALSFLICGILCFIISFIYHKIDISFKEEK